MKTINDIIAEVWPEWKLDSIIGAGTYGEVYRAVREDAGGKSTAAIKVIRIFPQNSRSAWAGPEEAKAFLEEARAHFSREIQVMQSLKGQSNLVSIDDYQIVESPEDAVLYYLIRMELLTPLLVDLDIRSYDEKALIRLGIDLCRGLEVCRSRQIVHRDIKPENIFVTPLGGYKLGDFGMARPLEAARESLTGWEFAPWDRFTAPEVKSGLLSSADFEEGHRADLYSLGMVLYWIANGRTFPFLKKASLHSSRDRNEAESRRMNGEPVPPIENLSPALDSAIRKACAFQNGDRYRSAEEFRQALEAILRPGLQPTQQPEASPIEGKPARLRLWMVPAAVLLAAALFAAGHLLSRQNSPQSADPPAAQTAANDAAVNETDADTLVFHDAEYPHVYHIGQPMTLGGYAVSDADLTDITIRLYTPEETYVQQIQPEPGTKRFDMKDAGDALFRKLGEGRFWFEIIASDAGGRTVGFSHTSTASRTAEDHTLYWINRSARPPELRGCMTHHGHTYEIYYLAGGGWDISNAFAQGRGGHLVSYTDKDEFSAVAGFALGMGCKWLSVGAQYQDGAWSWTDGTPFTFHPWNPDAPEDEDLPYIPFGGMVYANQQWFLGKATQYEMSFFIVEYDSAPESGLGETLPELPSITGETYPASLSNGQSFGLRGTISCRYPITEIRAAVVNLVTGETLYDVSVSPDATAYAIGSASGEPINDRLDFSSPRCSNSYLNYRLTVQYTRDGESCSKVVLDRDFTVGSPLTEPPEGFREGGF